LTAFGGSVYGATDELGLAAVENRPSARDWHATILYLLGLHYNGPSFAQNCLMEKLTGVNEAHTRKGILA